MAAFQEEYTESRTQRSPLDFLIFPAFLFFLAILLSLLQYQTAPAIGIIAGLGLDLAGAILLAVPDLAAGRYIPVPEKLQEARHQLFEVGHLVSGNEFDERVDNILRVIRRNWDGEILEYPYQIDLRTYHRYGSPEAVLLIYNKDAEAPKDYAERVSEGNEVDPSLVFEAEGSDWVAAKGVLYEWIGDEIARIQRRLRLLRAQGAIMLIFGFTLQIVATGI